MLRPRRDQQHPRKVLHEQQGYYRQYQVSIISDKRYSTTLHRQARSHHRQDLGQ